MNALLNRPLHIPQTLSHKRVVLRCNSCHASNAFQQGTIRELSFPPAGTLCRARAHCDPLHAENPVVRATINAATEVLRIAGVGRHADFVHLHCACIAWLGVHQREPLQVSRCGAAGEPANRAWGRRINFGQYQI